MSWVAIGVGVGTTALSIGGNAIVAANSGGGGGGGRINSRQIRETLNEYVGQVQAAISAGRNNVSAAVSGANRTVANAGNDLRGASDRETQAFWNRLGIFNESLINSASALVNEYEGNVNAALTTLESKINRLNQEYSQDMGAEITRYGSVENAVNAQLAADESVAESTFLNRVNQYQTEYRQDSLRETDAAKTESMSLGDTFMQRSQAAQERFDRVARQTPEFIQQASRAADQLSKAALQTRMDLLATADPRAMELSAIADENAAAMMSGRVSADVQANVARSSAMRALQGGFGASSEMGRGLAARDLGLTSLDLQQRGFDQFQRQRELNYQTRVAGTQATPFEVSEQMQRAEGTMLDASLRTAESDRNQRIGAVQEASGQRLQTFDRLFGARMGVADTLRGQDMTLAGQLSDNRRDANIRATGMRVAATQDIYNNNLGLANTVFNTTTGLAGQRLQTGLSTVSDTYQTNVSGAGTTYSTRMGAESSIFGGRTQTAIAGMNAQASYENSALQAISSALGQSAATQSNIPVIQAANSNAQAMQSAQLWGSALQAGSSLAGSYLGNQNWNANTGRTYGGGYSSAGAAYNAAPYASSLSYTRGTGYVPVASRA